jgi:hypothetical protein
MSERLIATSASTVGWLSLIWTLIAIVVAVAVPVWIESRRRPRFCFSAYEPDDTDGARFLRIRVINAPFGTYGRSPIARRLGKYAGKWLQRSTAAGCVASLTFTVRTAGGDEGATVYSCLPARWVARPQPTFNPRDGSRDYLNALEQAFRFDVSPSEDGEVIVVAVKCGSDSEAYAVSKCTYVEPGNPNENCSPKLVLCEKEYRLTVRVRAGGVEGESDFIVRNPGEAQEFEVKEHDRDPRCCGLAPS